MILTGPSDASKDLSNLLPQKKIASTVYKRKMADLMICIFHAGNLNIYGGAHQTNGLDHITMEIFCA